MNDPDASMNEHASHPPHAPRFANIIAMAVGASAAATMLLGLAVGEPLGDPQLPAVEKRYRRWRSPPW